MIIYTYFSATCADPTPTNGQVTPPGLNNGRYRINTTVSFICDIGYDLTGDHLESTCQTSGSWNPQPPSCLGNRLERIFLTCGLKYHGVIVYS